MCRKIAFMYRVFVNKYKDFLKGELPKMISEDPKRKCFVIKITKHWLSIC
jgi:hypothetical protein